MTAEFNAPIDRDKTPLLDADHDVVRIADALRDSPHIRSVVAAEPGDTTVCFTDARGMNFALSLEGGEPHPQGPQGEAYVQDAVAAAIGNHPGFVSAELKQDRFGPRNIETITALTRAGNEYTLTLTLNMQGLLAFPTADVTAPAAPPAAVELLDRDKSPLLDPDHDPKRIADALRTSPHILGARAVPGSGRVTFTTLAGNGFDLTLHDAEPTTDDILPTPVLTEALAAAILNHPEFCAATPDAPRENTLTIQTRAGVRYLLELDVDPDADAGDYSTPAEDLALAADRLLASNPSDAERATAELLNYIAATWDWQDLPLREHAQSVARSLTSAR